MPVHSAPALAFESVGKRFGLVSAVDGVSATIDGGSFVALVGTSGSGKSTLLRTVNRLVVPSAGRVLIDGTDVADGPAPLLRRRIGYVFQHLGLFPHMTVAENIAIGPRIAGRREDRVAELLDLVELPRTVSGRTLPGRAGGGAAPARRGRPRGGAGRAAAAARRGVRRARPRHARHARSRDPRAARRAGADDRAGHA